MKELEESKQKAAGLLARRRLTEKELYEKLIHFGFSEGTVSDTLHWAREYRFVDDAEYARMYIADAVNLKKHGRRRIEQALAYKGVDAFVVQDAFAEMDDNEYERLLPLVVKKLNGNFERKNVEKAVRSFAAKGYDFGDIREAVREASLLWEAQLMNKAEE